MVHRGAPESRVEVQREGVQRVDGKEEAAELVRLDLPPLPPFLQPVMAGLQLLIPRRQGVIPGRVFALVHGPGGVLLYTALHQPGHHLHLLSYLGLLLVQCGEVCQCIEDQAAILQQCLPVRQQRRRNAPEDDEDRQASPLRRSGAFLLFPSQTLRWFAMGALFNNVATQRAAIILICEGEPREGPASGQAPAAPSPTPPAG